MGLRIHTNLPSLRTRRILEQNTREQSKRFERVASGKRIVSSGDDSAGLSISENLKAQIRSMSQAERNVNDGITFVQVAEGALTGISDMIVRMRELAIQSSSDTVGDVERGYINQEFKSLIQEIDRIANVTTFNGTPLLNGTTLKTRDDDEKTFYELQVGIHNTGHDRLSFNISDNDIRAMALEFVEDEESIQENEYLVSTETIEDARESLNVIDRALDKINSTRAKYGAMQNRLRHTVHHLGLQKEGHIQANAQIADADLAHEISELTRENVLQNAGMAMLMQANSSPMQALKLL